MARVSAAAPVTVECPLCQEVLEVTEYDSITRTDVLAGHIVTKHASKALPMPPTEGPPLPRSLKLRWPWRK
jgi:hypothetical protein